MYNRIHKMLTITQSIRMLKIIVKCCEMFLFFMYFLEFSNTNVKMVIK